jgi:hypothetical protein
VELAIRVHWFTKGTFSVAEIPVIIKKAEAILFSVITECQSAQRANHYVVVTRVKQIPSKSKQDTTEKGLP